ncbi:protein of unknown function [Agrobacterium pusense]|uniref:Uncharacterized protein n=1 Tax=Agrobacterium pusense TaxID=648995 RepID=U4QA53_9HYPH|nr:protein of unknown function [Agrobacterium pusense]
MIMIGKSNNINVVIATFNPNPLMFFGCSKRLLVATFATSSEG